MNPRSIILAAVMLVAAPRVFADLPASLQAFSTYQPGQPRTALHEARRLAFRDTQQTEVRARNEQLLLDFIQSDATPAARCEACRWLGSLATEKSHPVLVKLARTEDLGEAATLCLLALDAPPQPAPVYSNNPLAGLRASAVTSKDPATVLIAAFQGKNPALSRLAFGLAAEGLGGGKVAEWLADNLLKLPDDQQLLALNTLAALDETRALQAAATLATKGGGPARAEAVSRLGRPTDVERLAALLTDGVPALAAAARRAFVRLDAAIAHPYLLGALRAKEPPPPTVVFDIIGDRGAPFATAELRAVAGDGKSPDRAAAIRALGNSAAAADFEPLLATYINQAAGPLQRDYQTAVWTVALRHPDYPQVIALIERHAKSAPPEIAKSLTGMVSKLAKLQAVPSLDQVRAATTPKPHRGVLLPGPISEITPKRFEVAAYLDCGPQTRISQNGISIKRLTGDSFDSGEGIHAAISTDYAASSLDYEITGLEPGTDYLLGMTWWDPGLQSRRQSLSINGELVLPDARPIAFDEAAVSGAPTPAKPTPARIQFALQPEQIASGSIRLSIQQLAGPNAVNSELWILKRSRPAAAKQVLLLSGQDYPGHHWRKTGPLMADTLTADPRLEVTICESPYALGLRNLAHYDVVFIHFKNYDAQLPSTSIMHSNLTRFLSGGGGMCLSHFACGAMEEWPEFVGLAGRVWNGQGHDPRGPFTVHVVDSAHPVTRGVGDFETTDELYFCLRGDPEIHLLCDARSKAKGTRQPQAFVYQPGRGRVFLCTLGHDLQAYEAAGTRTLYRQAAAWTAGLE